MHPIRAFLLSLGLILTAQSSGLLSGSALACTPFTQAVDILHPVDGSVHPLNGLIYIAGEPTHFIVTLRSSTRTYDLEEVTEFGHHRIQGEPLMGAHAVRVYRPTTPPKIGETMTLSAKSCDDCTEVNASYTAGPVDDSSPAPVAGLSFKIATFDHQSFHLNCGPWIEGNRLYFVSAQPSSTSSPWDRYRIRGWLEDGGDLLFDHTHSAQEGLEGVEFLVDIDKRGTGGVCVSAQVMNDAGNLSEEVIQCNPCSVKDIELEEGNPEDDSLQELPLEPTWDGCYDSEEGACLDSDAPLCTGGPGCSSSPSPQGPWSTLGIFFMTLGLAGLRKLDPRV